MSLDQKKHRYFERFFPGLIRQLNELGATALDLVCDPINGLRGIKLNIRTVLDDGMELELRTYSRQKKGFPPYSPAVEDVSPVALGEWERVSYSLHYGRKYDEAEFRFDLDVPSGHHVHMRPNPKDHVPAVDVDPDTVDMDPRQFVALVAAYRATRIYPVQRKKR